MRLDRERDLLGLVDDRLQSCAFGQGVARGWSGEASEHPLDRLRASCRLIRGHGGSVRVVAEQLCTLRPQTHDREKDRTVVVRVVARPACERGRHDATSRFPRAQLRQSRVACEERESDQELSVQVPVRGGTCGSGELSRAQSVELVGRVEHHGQVVGVVQQVALERVGQGRQLLVHGGQPRLRFVVEARTGQGHLAMTALHEVPLLRIEVQCVELLVHLLHTPVEPAVERDRILMRCHERRELLVDLLDLGRRIGRTHRVEGVRDTIQQLAGSLQRLKGVLERGHRAHHGDALDLAELLLETRLESGEIVLRPNRGVVGEPVGKRRRLQQRIGGVGHPPSLSTAPGVLRSRSRSGASSRREGLPRPRGPIDDEVSRAARARRSSGACSHLREGRARGRGRRRCAR